MNELTVGRVVPTNPVTGVTPKTVALKQRTMVSMVVGNFLGTGKVVGGARDEVGQDFFVLG